MRGKVFGKLHAVFAVLLHSKRQRFQIHIRKPRIHRRSSVTTAGNGGKHEGEVPESLCVNEPMVAFVGRSQPREFVGR